VSGPDTTEQADTPGARGEATEPAESADAAEAAPKPGTLAARRAAARTGAATPARPVSRRTRTAAAPSDGTPEVAIVRVGAPLEGGRDETTAFLLQSLRDLEAEHAAGDIDDDDYEALKDDYTVRAAAALRAEQRGKAPPPPVKQRRSARQWAMIVSGVVGFAVLAGVLVAQAAGDRSAGQGATGTVIDSPTQAAGRCIGLSGELQAGSGATTDEVLGCYQDVLDEDPDNPVARTYLGWTLYITARQAAASLTEEQLAELYVEAHRQLDLAVEADPRYADARAFQVVLAAREGRYADAAEQLAVFDELDVPADMQVLVDGVRQEITDGLAAEGSTGTTGSTSAPPTSTTAPG
jgi:hypothetical protein